MGPTPESASPDGAAAGPPADAGIAPAGAVAPARPLAAAGRAARPVVAGGREPGCAAGPAVRAGLLVGGGRHLP